MSAQLLLVRAGDLVVLGVEAEGCEVQLGRLVAVSAPAQMTLVLPPQSIQEDKSGEPRAARLAGPTRLVCHLPVGAGVDLTVPGVTSALAEHGVDGLASTIELPFGLVLHPTRAGGPLAARAEPETVTGPDATATGLWQLVLADPTGSGPVVAKEVDAPDRADLVDAHPLNGEQRAQIADSGLEVLIERLRLSALGGTLTASASATWMAWDHRAALGRDEFVRFEQSGVLYPFGHRATLIQKAYRVVDNGVAGLRRESELRISQPLVVFPDDGSARSRAFPFHEVEIVGPTVTGVRTRGHVFWTRPQDLTDLIQQRIFAIDNVDLPARVAEFDGANPQPVPVYESELTPDSAWYHSAIGTAANAQYEIARIDADIQSYKDGDYGVGPGTNGGTNGTNGGTNGPGVDGDTDGDGLPDFIFEDESSGDRTELDELEPPMPAADDPAPWIPAWAHERIKALEAEKVPHQATYDAARVEIDAWMRFLASIRPNAYEQGDSIRWAERLAAMEPPRPGAPEVVALVAERRRLDDLTRQEALPTASRVVVDLPVDDPPDYVFSVRLANRAGDVTLRTPLFFLADQRVPVDPDYLPDGYLSLDDPTIVQGLGTVEKPIVATAVDLVRRHGEPAKPTDIQELHSVLVSSTGTPQTLVPTLDGFTLALPELRSLLPGKAETERPARGRLGGEFLSTGSTAVPVELDRVEVDFGDRAERGGGLVVPSLAADRISESLGPTAQGFLSGSEADARAALGKMRLFGFGLDQLVRTVGGPPSILQALEDGLPRGVTLRWEPQRLRSIGPFRARARGEADDTTTFDLTVEQTLSATTTSCRVSAFSLALPTPDLTLLEVFFGGMEFTIRPGRPPDLKVVKPELEFGGALELLKKLQEELPDLGGTGPDIDVREDGVTTSIAVRIGEANGGAFLMRNIAFLVRVDIPFRRGLPTVELSFASREAPFELRIPPFGGTGYLQLGLSPKGLSKVDGQLEFGGSIGVDFVIAKAEVHVLAGIRVQYDGRTITAAGFLRIGGSVSILGLVTVSVDLKVELAYVQASNSLTGRATLVIEIDLTFYADSVELDSGVWSFSGNQQSTPGLGAPPESEWGDYQGAYA